MRAIATLVLATLGFIGLPAPSSGQALGTIAGAVKDASGAVLPGVTVEASSPALIEKARTVVTDGNGQYQIISLPPGVYTVTIRTARGSERTSLRRVRFTIRYGKDGRLASVVPVVPSAPRNPWLRSAPPSR